MSTAEQSISCTLFFWQLYGCVQKQPFGGALKSTCDEERLEKFQQRSSFFNQGTVYRPAMLIKINLFTSIFNDFNRKPFVVALRFSKQLFTEHRVVLSCAISNITIENFTILQRSRAAHGFYLCKTFNKQIQIHLNFVVLN